MNATGPIELIIIGAIVIIILFMFRKRLRKFIFQIGKDGLRSELHAGDAAAPGADRPSAAPPPSGGVVVSGNVQAGQGHRIDVGRRGAAVSDNVQTGREHEIVVPSESAPAGPIPAGGDEAPPDQARRVRLRRFLVDHFNEGDLRDLCFDLGFAYDSLPHSGTGNKTREIVSYLAHRGRLDELEAYCRRQRPGADW